MADDVIQLEQHSSQYARSQAGASLLRSGKQIHVEDDRQMVPSRLAVAFACRQMYLEVTPIYYSQSCFALSLISMVTALENAKGFAIAAGPDNARCIRNLCLVVPGISPMLHLRLSLILEGGVRGNSPLTVLKFFLAGTQAIFRGKPTVIVVT